MPIPVQAVSIQDAGARAGIIAEPCSAEADRFVVGQDPQGYWVAVEVHGRGGGLFRSRQAAVRYAEGETDHRSDAVSLSGDRIAFKL